MTTAASCASVDLPNTGEYFKLIDAGDQCSRVNISETSISRASRRARLFGFFKKVKSEGKNQYTSDHEADHSVHYIDLVITEIPSIACKINNKGKEIISRIPFNADAGSLIYYRTPEHELQTSNYFYPIKLSQLTIQLIDDHGNIYDCNNADNSFEFELTILQNTALLQ